MQKGSLRVRIIDSHNSKPISNAKVVIKDHEAEEDIKTHASSLREYSSITNSLGYTRIFELDTHTKQVSQDNVGNKLFSVWDIRVKASGFKTCIIKGIEIFPGIISVETCKLKVLSTKESNIDAINVLPNAIFEKYPPKIPELAEEIGDDAFKKIYGTNMMTMPISLVVHDGLPEDKAAENYTVGFQDYIKNVACGCMYPTWNENSLRAGVLSIISFTLNRVFTQHYRKKGSEYDITSSTAYDQLFSYGRSIHLNISKIVDELYPMYVAKSGQKSPMLVQSCDGIRNEYPGWFSHWKSNLLGQQGKSVKAIIKSLLGEDIEIYNLNKVDKEMRTKAVNRYRSFVPPMLPYSSEGVMLKVSYPEDV